MFDSHHYKQREHTSQLCKPVCTAKKNITPAMVAVTELIPTTKPELERILDPYPVVRKQPTPLLCQMDILT